MAVLDAAALSCQIVEPLEGGLGNQNGNCSERYGVHWSIRSLVARDANNVVAARDTTLHSTRSD
jgi:hypothetical protein